MCATPWEVVEGSKEAIHLVLHFTGCTKRLKSVLNESHEVSIWLQKQILTVYLMHLLKFLSLFPESVDAHQRSFDVGIHIGYQRRNKDVLAWVKKRRRTIRREDLISFLCGKAPPPRNSRAPPRLTVVSPNRATSTETSSSVETDLQPFREAIALHGNGSGFFNAFHRNECLKLTPLHSFNFFNDREVLRQLTWRVKAQLDWLSVAWHLICIFCSCI